MEERLKRLEELSIKLILSVYKNSDKQLHAGNSGGKDSAVIDKLLQLSGVPYHSYYTNTTIDPNGTIGHIRRLYPYTEIMQPKETFYKLVERKGLPTRLNRYCCEKLKEYGSIGKIVFEGVRSEESSKRKGRDYVQCDSRKWQKEAQHVYPIYDWTELDVYAFIKKYDIKLAPVYSLGMKRLGCVGCPLVSRKGHREMEFKLYPKHYIQTKKAITVGMLNNPQWKLSCATDGDGEKAMQWWLSGKTMGEYFSEYKFEKIEVGWSKHAV